MFNEYPYRNLTDLNLDYLLRSIRQMQYEIKNFVLLNSISYADPIQWNITRQYKKNTVVIDPATGTAYISVQPVPSGIQISDTDFWTVVFDLSLFITRGNKNITIRVESEGVIYATFPINKGQMVIWNGDLYTALTNIVVNEAYVIGLNIKRATIEDLFGNLEDLRTSVKTSVVDAINDVLDTISNIAGDLNDLNTTDKSNLVNAINDVLTTIATIAGDLNDLNTTDKSNLVNAINDVLTVIGALTDLNTTDQTSIVNAINEVLTIIGALTDLNTTDQTSIVNAINEVLTIIGTLTDLDTSDQTSIVNAINEVIANMGDLNDLNTTDKTSIVNAINEVAAMPKGVIYNVKDFGAVGDGVTNDYAAIVAAMNAADSDGLSIIYFPDGEYNCGSGQFTLDTSKYMFWGGANAEIISSGLTGSVAFITLTSPLSLDQYSFNRCPIKQLSIKGNYFTDTATAGVIGVKMGTDTTFVAPHCVLENVNIINFAIGLEMSSGYKTTYINCSFIANNRGINVPAAGVQQAVPCTFIGCYWECNNYAIFAAAYGYNNFSIFGGAFEYNRSVFTTVMKMSFFGTRFEYDCKASCDAALNVRAVFNGASGGGRTIVKFTNCYFLGLDNFASNVSHWIANPYKATAYNISPFYLYGGGSKISCEFYQCEIEDSNQPSGVYYIDTDKYKGSGNYTHSLTGMVATASVASEANGFIQ